MQCAVCSVQCAVCSVQCGSIHTVMLSVNQLSRPSQGDLHTVESHSLGLVDGEGPGQAQRDLGPAQNSKQAANKIVLLVGLW